MSEFRHAKEQLLLLESLKEIRKLKEQLEKRKLSEKELLGEIEKYTALLKLMKDSNDPNVLSFKKDLESYVAQLNHDLEFFASDIDGITFKIDQERGIEEEIADRVIEANPQPPIQ